MAEGNKPEKKFIAGAISATVWANPGKTREGKEITFSSVSLDRRYKDKNEEWQSTSSLRVNDLPKAQLVLGQAYEYLVTKRYEERVQEEAVEGNTFPPAKAGGF